MLKDRNFLELSDNYKKIGLEVLDLPSQKQDQIYKILEQDSKFLRGHNLMDYSVYLTVEKLKPDKYYKFNQRI